MRILIEALGIHYVGGGRSATMNLLETLFALDTETEYTVLLSQPEPLLDVPARNVRQIVTPTQNRFALRLWAQMLIPLLARDHDLVHFCKNLTVAGVPTKTVVTVYDLTTLILPHLFPRADVLYWRWIQPRMLSRVDRIISISQTTARDLIRFYGLSRDRIAVIYATYGARFAPVDEIEIQRVRDKYELPKEVLLNVGRIDPKNNISTLVRAYARFREGNAFAGKLVLVGGEYSKSRDTAFRRVVEELGLSDSVLITGCVPVEDLPGLYASATMVVFPSLHEGFGIVAAEAMACGTPLVVSDAGALPEVVGDAALVFGTPHDVDALAAAMARLLQNADLRQELREKGLSWVQRYQPRDVALQTLTLYRDVVGMSG